LHPTDGEIIAKNASKAKQREHFLIGVTLKFVMPTPQPHRPNHFVIPFPARFEEIRAACGYRFFATFPPPLAAKLCFPRALCARALEEAENAFGRAD
jgi:hypothetical protein